MKSVKIVKNRRSFTLLGPQIKTSTAIFISCHEEYPFDRRKVILSKVVFLIDCSLSCLHYNLTKRTFPNAEHIYVSGKESSQVPFPGIWQRFEKHTVILDRKYYSPEMSDYVDYMPRKRINEIMRIYME